MIEIVNKFLRVGNKFIPEMNLNNLVLFIVPVDLLSKTKQ